MADYPRGVVPPGTYAGGGRSPIVYVWLCPPCGGYAPITDEDYSGALSGRCQGCGANSRELHRFQAMIMSAANGGCRCEGHRQVTGDLPTEESAMQLWTEVKTRPPAREGFIPGRYPPRTWAEEAADPDVTERRRHWRAGLRDPAVGKVLPNNCRYGDGGRLIHGNPCTCDPGFA